MRIAMARETFEIVPMELRSLFAVELYLFMATTARNGQMCALQRKFGIPVIDNFIHRWKETIYCMALRAITLSEMIKLPLMIIFVTGCAFGEVLIFVFRPFRIFMAFFTCGNRMLACKMVARFVVVELPARELHNPPTDRRVAFFTSFTKRAFVLILMTIEAS
jgi:hypothetical protein